MRWTWEYLGTTRVLHDDITPVYVPSAGCVQIRVPREVGCGMPPNNNETENRVQANAGRVWLFNYLEQRIIRLTLSLFGAKVDAVGEEDHILARRKVAQWFNPQPTAPDGILTFHSRDVVRAINARYDSGYEWDWLYVEEQGEFVDEVRFLCPDPLWYDPVLQTATWAQSGDLSLVLCYELPYTLCTGKAFTQNVTNAGDWATYPIITVNGPAADVTITNTTTGEVIGATYTLAAGKSATYDLTPGIKTVFDSDGNNLMSTLLQPNDLATFHLACAYEYDDSGNIVAPGGVNVITVNTSVTATTIDMQWYNRYLTN